MHALTPEKLLAAFIKLGSVLAHPGDALTTVIGRAPHYNAWFTEEMTAKAVAGIASMINEKDLRKWFETIKVTGAPKKIGLILAGNIPLVGFHDVLCVLATGNTALIKLSSQDDQLVPAVLEELLKIEPLLSERVVYTERLKDFDAVIATGSNNSSRYFDFYFSKVPHIIRSNRNSVAVLTGSETPEEIAALGNDIFDYFGLGCRNVSKLFIPAGYDIKFLFEPLESFQPIIHHFKYNNNYDYNKSIFLVNLVPHYDNGFVLLKEDQSLASPLAVLYYEYYNDLDAVAASLNAQAAAVQCVVSRTPIGPGIPFIAFGQTQTPRLWDYADNLDTIAFLTELTD